MAKSMRVTAQVQVDVTGADDVDGLSEALEGAAKAADKDLKVAASVAGADDVSELADTIGEIPASTPAKISASVSGADDVGELATDVDGLPATSSTKVTGTVSGAAEVHGLASDVAHLPATAATKVTGTVSGADDVHGLAADVDGLPASTSAKISASVSNLADVETLAGDIDKLPENTTVKVDTSVNGGSGKRPVKDLGDEIDTTKGKAKSLGVEGAAFGSQFLGPYSEGAALFGDLSEKLSQLGDEAGDGSTGISGKLKGIALIGAGLGAGLIAGLAIDAVLGAFTKLKEGEAAVQTSIENVSAALVDNGGFWNQAATLAQLSAVEQSGTFQDLLKMGIPYEELIKDFTDTTGQGAAKINAILEPQGKSLGILAKKEVDGYNTVAGASKDAAKAKYDYLKANDLLTDSQKEQARQAEDDAAGLTRTAQSARSVKEDTEFATKAVKGYNDQPMHDKKSTLTATDNASGKVESANQKKLTDKKSTLTAKDDVTPAVHSANQSDLADKSMTLHSNVDDAQALADLADLETPREVTVRAILDAQQAKADLEDARFALGSHSVAGSSSPAPAPRVHAGALATSSATVTAPVVINVSGALDPVAVGQQIDRLLTARRRRVHPPQLGGAANANTN